MRRTTTTEMTILGIAAKAQAAKAQAVVILILAPPPTIGGSIESIGAYKSKHVSHG